MRIWLDQVREEPFRWDETESVDPQALGHSELLELSPVAWRGQVIWADPGYFLRAHLSYQQTLRCDRCLKAFTEPADSDVELMIEVEKHRGFGGEHELHENDLGVLYLPEEILETRPLLIEQLQLNVPMKPLCKADCQGLCPVCGIDWNTGRCECRQEEVDPRWAALAEIKELKGRSGGES